MTDANAEIISFSTPINVPNNFDGIYLNLLTGASATLGSGVPGWDFNAYNSGTALSFFWSATPSQASGVVSGTVFLDLPAGAVVSSASTFGQGTAAANTVAFQTPGTHNLGFRFYNETAGIVNYGYMSLTSAGANGFPLTINGWAIETAGTAITVVPEPATGAMLSMGALALGALNLRRLRRQRKQLAA